MAKSVIARGIDSVSIDLFAPGMSPIHRAGLGGLAATLRAMEDYVEDGKLKDDEIPGGPWHGISPWTVEPTRITLRFGEPKLAGEYLKRLFAFAFKILPSSGLIYLPGQHDTQPPDIVLADLQLGMTLTFLQHGKTRKLSKEPTTRQFDVEDSKPPLTVEYRACSWFKHQDGWKEFASKGPWKNKPVEVVGPISPGSAVRHVAFSGQTKIEEPPERALALYFAIVGCLALPINLVSAVLIVPDVDDLSEFSIFRSRMTPSDPRHCRITSPADAAFQAVTRETSATNAAVRLRSAKVTSRISIPECHTMLFRSTPWASQQKSRVSTSVVPTDDRLALKKFELLLANLAPHIAVRKGEQAKGKKKGSKEPAKDASFRVDSVVRPMAAENLARGQPWYLGFRQLMTDLDSQNRPIRDRVRFEKEGLAHMVEVKELWDDEGERAIVQAVHDALRRRYGEIASDNKSNPVAMKNRFSTEYERRRLAFAGAKTADDFRNSLCDFLSRAGFNDTLRQRWQEVLPLLSDRHWRRARDLALLGLASYSGASADKDESTNEQK